MTCSQMEDLIEAVAAGDVAPDAAFEAHVAGCRGCAAALDLARRLERTLAGVAVPAAPAGFARSVVARVRRERWQYEQRVDRVFNLTIGIGVLVMIAAAVSLMNLGRVATILLVGLDTLTDASRQPAPWAVFGATPSLALAVAAFVTAIAVWWWAGRQPTEAQ